MILIWLLATLAAIVWLTIKFQLHPFLALLGAALFLGFVGGISPANLANTIATLLMGITGLLVIQVLSFIDLGSYGTDRYLLSGNFNREYTPVDKV